MDKTKYIIISPVRNEEDYIEKTISSVISQTKLPAEWVIVNDGSTDKTPEIIDNYTNKFSWIKRVDRPINGHRPGPGVVLAFNNGLNETKIQDFDFVVKLDGDLSFEPDYFELLIKEFEKNPNLGMASGTTYNVKGDKLVADKMPDDHVRGAAKMYKKQCFDDIEGLPVVLGWDTIDELKAQMLGWETKSYKDLVLKHYKPIGFKQKKTFAKEILAGERLHYLGYHPLFAILKCINELKSKPIIFRGILMLVGYLEAIVKNAQTMEDREMIKYLRKKQLKRLKKMIRLG
jgi:glycosyltransferase involved in cell wall biosynthesis